MSSHHFVKEDQEPAVVFLSVASLVHNTILDLLEWSPRVLAWESVIEKLITLQVNIDQAYVHDVGSWKPILESIQPIIKIESCKEAQGVVELALQKEYNQGIKAMHVITCDRDISSYIDKLDRNFSQITFTYFTESGKHMLIKSGVFEKWLASQEEVIITPLDSGIDILSHGPVKRSADDSMLDSIGFVTQTEGFVRLEEKCGKAFLLTQKI